MPELLNALLGQQVHDVIAPGWLERGTEHPRFGPWSSVLYLHLEGGVLALSLAKEITVPPDWPRRTMNSPSRRWVCCSSSTAVQRR